MLSTVVSLTTVERGITKVRKTTVCNMRGVIEICRYNTNPKTNALIDCIYHTAALLSLAGSRRRAAVTHFST